MGIGYSFYDWTHTSHAEAQRNKYKKLYNALDSKISSIDDSLPYVESAIRELHTYYTTNPDSAKGQMATTFTTKEEEFHAKCTGIYSDMKAALADLKTKKEKAKELYDYWENECRLEDEEEETRTYN